MIYFSLFSLVILASSIVKAEKQKYILYLFAFILFFILGFRAESVGTDTIHYKGYFDILERGGYPTVEIGWIFLNKLVIWNNSDFDYLLILVSALTIFPVVFVISRHSSNPLFSLFLYYTLYLYFYSFNISRQSLAVTVTFAALIFLINNNKRWFLILVVLSSLIHISSLIVLPLIFVDKIPDKKSIYFVGLICTAAIGLVYTEYLANYLIQIESYSGYFEKYDFQSLTGTSAYLTILNTFFVFILFSIRKTDSIYFKLFFCYILASNVLVRIPFNGRLLMFISVFLILFFPYYLNNSKFKNSSILYSIVIIYSYLIFFRTFGSGEILPYVNRLF